MGIEDFELLGAVDAGGFGTVYRARQQFTERIVALKIIDRAGVVDQDAMTRFRRECRALAALNHPNVVTIHDANVTADGVPYLAMEFMGGGTLADDLPLDVHRAVAVITEGALGLQALHDAGIIHRDIKPQNLLLSTEGAVKIGDLGLASLGEALGASLMPTQGALAGTFPYMAPELLEGAAPSVASDVYALGATLYELLAGAPPFLDLRNPAPGPLLLRISRESAEPLPRSIPRHIAEVVRSALSKDPKQRPSSAADLAVQLSVKQPPEADRAPRRPSVAAPTEIPPVQRNGSLLPNFRDGRNGRSPISLPGSTSPLPTNAADERAETVRQVRELAQRWTDFDPTRFVHSHRPSRSPTDRAIDAIADETGHSSETIRKWVERASSD